MNLRNGLILRLRRNLAMRLLSTFFCLSPARCAFFAIGCLEILEPWVVGQIFTHIPSPLAEHNE